MNFKIFDLVYLLVLLFFTAEVIKLVIFFIRRVAVAKYDAGSVSPSSMSFVSIIIPARNEAKRFGKCLTGEFILWKRKGYDAIGGHAAFKSTVSDDLDFSMLLERTDFATGFIYAEDIAVSRMYSSFTQIYEGISKMLQRLLSENKALAMWRSTKYFLFSAMMIISTDLFLRHYHPELFPPNMLLLLPALILAVCIGATFYLRFFFLFGILMPPGWLFQPVMLVKYVKGEKSKTHVWRGRKVIHNSNNF